MTSSQTITKSSACIHRYSCHRAFLAVVPAERDVDDRPGAYFVVENQKYSNCLGPRVRDVRQCSDAVGADYSTWMARIPSGY